MEKQEKLKSKTATSEISRFTRLALMEVASGAASSAVGGGSERAEGLHHRGEARQRLRTSPHSRGRWDRRARALPLGSSLTFR